MIENSIFESVRLLPNVKTHDSEVLSNPDFSEKTLELPQGKRFVVYAGTLEPYQGIDILLEAFKQVVSKTKDAHLIIVGGDNAQVEFYSNFAETLGLSGKTLLTGRVSQILAKHYCKLASVLVSPRSEGTNTPLKIYEQLASGIPLVATNIYSHTQVLNGDVAFLVEPNPNEMAAGILNALNQDEEKYRIVANARNLYDKMYSRPVYVKKMRNVIEILE
jgi:glycosyltransferase involved in cell wall biosynthesis